MQPQRTCVGCRRRGDKAELTRLVWDSPLGLLRIDREQRLPGRGCYLHPECVAVAVSRRAVGRALRVSLDPAVVADALQPLGGIPTTPRS